MKIGLFYGSTTGNTEFVAQKIKDELGGELAFFKNIIDTKPEDIQACDGLIFGMPTWDIGELQSDWMAFFPKLDEMDFHGKTVAIFGLGDQFGYPDTFLDAVGTLGKKVQERGGKLIGFWPTEGYDFKKSLGQVDEKFMGLAIDIENQNDQTDDRIRSWVAQIKDEFGI